MSTRRGVYIGECGHRRPILPTGRIGACACDRPDYRAQLCAAVEDLARSRYLLDQVIELAGESAGLTDAELRHRLTVLADRTRHRVLSGFFSLPAIPSRGVTGVIGRARPGHAPLSPLTGRSRDLQ